MRTRLITTLLLSILGFSLLLLIITRVLAFAHIFYGHSGPAMTQEEVLQAYEAANEADGAARKEYIPRIIHQIYHNWKDPSNTTLPADWAAQRQSCIDENPGYKYELWTDKSSRKFLTDKYPWFLEQYDKYTLPVQKVDALRYFLMRHFGGIYIDLDNGCSAPLAPLLRLPAFVTDGGKGALSNNILGARPNHPYWVLMTDSLIPWGYTYPFPYFTVSYSSGQWFETAIWEQYHKALYANVRKTKGTKHPEQEVPEEDKLYRIMMSMDPGAAAWVFFNQGRGGSWDNWDNHLFGSIGQWFAWIRVNIGWILLGIAVLVGLLAWRKGRWLRLRGRRGGYKEVPGGGGSSGDDDVLEGDRDRHEERRVERHEMV